MTVQRIGGDSIYGTGSDGTVIINSNTSLSRDMYYNSLTINANVVLNTNGYRLFVKNTLNISGTIESNISSNSVGTLAGPRGVSLGNVSYSIGGNAANNRFVVSQLNDGQKADIISLLTGTISDPVNGVIKISGGAGGDNGLPGVVTPGNAAGAGTLNRTAGYPGGPGLPGTTPPAAVGGSGGRGGGVVLISAKNIIGNGYIYARGGNAEVGGNAATGNVGNSAPNESLSHNVDGFAHYRTGDGVNGPHASVATPNLPHGGHVPATSVGIHGHNYRYVHAGTTHHSAGHVSEPPASHSTWTADHGQRTAGQHDHGHTWNPFSQGSHVDTLTGTFFAINGISHVYAHRPHSGVAYSSDHYHTSGGFNYIPTYYPSHTSHSPASHNKVRYPPAHYHYSYPYTHYDYTHQYQRHRQAGTVSSVGNRTFPGGSGGTAGSTTAGQPGIAGGGGGIIIITNSISNTVTTSTSGGTGPTANGSSGSVITIIND